MCSSAVRWRLDRARLQKSVMAIPKCLPQQGIEFSVSKSATVTFTRKRMNSCHVTVLGQKTPQVWQHIFLTIIFYRDLSWTLHMPCFKEQFSAFVISSLFVRRPTGPRQLGSYYGGSRHTILDCWGSVYLYLAAGVPRTYHPPHSSPYLVPPYLPILHRLSLPVYI